MSVVFRGIEGPVPVWLSTFVATFFYEYVFVGPNSISMPWQEYTIEVDSWAIEAAIWSIVVRNIFVGDLGNSLAVVRISAGGDV